MCLCLICVLPRHKTYKSYVLKIKKAEKFALICMEEKYLFDFAWKTLAKKKRMFSHWQILSSCVSNETEGIESLVHFFVSTLLLLMAAKKNAACLRGSCLLSLFSIGMVDYACHTPLK